MIGSLLIQDWVKDGSPYADRPVLLDIYDPDGRLGGRAVIRLRRKGRTPAVLSRSLLLDNKGQGRFFGWMPVSLEAIGVSAAESPSQSGERLRVRLRGMSIAELAVRLLIKHPVVMWRALKLLAAGNVKGFQFRIVRLCDGLSAPSYQTWARSRTAVNALDDRRQAWEQEADLPMVIVSVDGDEASVKAAVRLLAEQSYPHIQILATQQLRAFISGCKQGRTFLWMRLPADMHLEREAISFMVHVFHADSSVAAVYCDEDRYDRHGVRREPFFRPAWNPPLAQSGWLSAEGSLFRLSCLPEALDLSETKADDMLLLASERGRIAHVPRVLVHRREARPRPKASIPRQASRQAPVSVIIPTRDRADLLAACLDGLLTRTLHGGLDIIVIDNESREAETLSLLSCHEASGSIRRVALSGAFNFARACNLGVQAARYDRILLLNNDVEPLDADWLCHLSGELDQPDIGAAGGLLLFPDGFVQHGGVTLGAGSVARHSFHFQHPEGGEDYGLLAQRREVSAVTAACLMTRRDLWRQVGGMNEEHLAVAFNDVDYCLKLRRAGYTILWTSHARLVHRESVSRGADDTPEKIARFAREECYMHETWGKTLQNDPFYNPNLSLTAGDFVLEAQPRDLSPRFSR